MKNSVEQSSNQHHSAKDGRDAIIYQSLFLMNLLLIPGLSFLILIWLFIKKKHQKGWQCIHLYRSIQLSILAGFFIIVIPLVVLLTTDAFEVSLMVMIIYFVTMHAAFVLLGMLNVSRAMAKKLPLF
ncbi:MULTISPECIES: hypothetical protein [unclassified Colwellia]|jgi:hypothetical protein|uniref:hypothetical protein n=1 Tax=unclassified Colwellia TaxID=196834 RepID=UPI0015F3BFC6|nr:MULTISPECIES: hypothetical protein [unclassified Colwellia]MBA6347600.1 hypothetical protein [Colwellia sp. BRX8-9]MBA6351630.1 hypothetical protein [Colwellia sp. BRX9-1]MBA6356549.1 hypothetical protein [Colwellia sp. BRX8-3]MBA6359335.1 hypothetical protein [Colwellia sp. BRX8-6]MBA6367947.1 hypothetical protein [Colwellia sp. BRX8-5]